MKTGRRIVVIIPSPCSESSHLILKRCVDSLITSAKLSRTDLKIIVVTNGEILHLKGIRKNVNLIIKVENPYSFAKMNNIAIEKSLIKFNPNWTLLMNDDAYVKRTFFKYFNLGILKTKYNLLVPLVYNHKGPEIDSFGIEYFCSGHAKNSQKIKIKTQLVAAACLFIKTDLLKQMKLKYGFYFNELLISYLEDVEFSIRAMAIGAKILKIKQMIAYHEVSYTNGKKGNYIFYQSFRNLIWLILMTWPLKIIIKNIFNILIVQCYMLILSFRKLNPWVYIKIWPATIKELSSLLKLRRKIIGAYSSGFKFEKILSPHSFRTSRKTNVKFLNIV